jgi:hypothetical protein
MVWRQLFVRSVGPFVNRGSLLEKIDGSLHYQHAFFVSSSDGPVMGQDGTWEIRAESSPDELATVRKIIKDNGLEIVREEEH